MFYNINLTAESISFVILQIIYLANASNTMMMTRGLVLNPNVILPETEKD